MTEQRQRPAFALHRLDAKASAAWVERHVIKLTAALILLLFLGLSQRGGPPADYRQPGSRAHRRRLGDRPAPEAEEDWGSDWGNDWGSGSPEWERAGFRALGKRRLYPEGYTGRQLGRGQRQGGGYGRDVETMERAPLGKAATSALAREGLLLEDLQAELGGAASTSRRRRAQLREGPGLGWRDTELYGEGLFGEEEEEGEGAVLPSPGSRAAQGLPGPAGPGHERGEGQEGAGGGGRPGVSAGNPFRHKPDLTMSGRARADAASLRRKRQAWELLRDSSYPGEEEGELEDPYDGLYPVA